MATTWEDYVDKWCTPFEEAFLTTKFSNRTLLVRALTRVAKLNEKVEFKELKDNGDQKGLDTIGDTILDFVIIDYFSHGFSGSIGKEQSPEKLTFLRKKYANNAILHKFSRNHLHLQNYILWGNDELNKERWNDEKTELLADCFEAVIGAVYIDQGIEEVIRVFNRIQFFTKVNELLSGSRRVYPSAEQPSVNLKQGTA